MAPSRTLTRFCRLLCPNCPFVGRHDLELEANVHEMRWTLIHFLALVEPSLLCVLHPRGLVHFIEIVANQDFCIDGRVHSGRGPIENGVWACYYRKCEDFYFDPRREALFSARVDIRKFFGLSYVLWKTLNDPASLLTRRNLLTAIARNLDAVRRTNYRFVRQDDPYRIQEIAEDRHG